MSKPLNILVVRFSSIGDIVLTTPLIRCLKLQLAAEIDFLTKSTYKEVVVSNPNIREVITVTKGSNKIRVLRKKKYDFVIDLQNNIRSFKVRFFLGVKSYVISKETFKRYVLIYFGINLLTNHVVERYFKTVKNLNVYNDKMGVDYSVSTKPPKLGFNEKQDYICWCLGGSYEQKKLSITQIINIASKISMPILFIGGRTDKEISSKIISATKAPNLFDLCGETTISESAYFIAKSKLVLTNDTGMMHIASAFDNPIISFWGCTKPSLGFGAYLPNVKSHSVISNLSERPCSKHGQYCRFYASGCIKKIDEKRVVNVVQDLLKQSF